MNIFAINTLSSKQYYEARDLIAICAQNDGTRGVSFFEPELNEDVTFPAFYMMYDEARLVSFLSVFLSGDTEGEVYGYTLPEYRQKGCFKKLYKMAVRNMKTAGYKEVICVCEPECESGKAVLEKMGLKVSRTEHLMSYDMSLVKDSDIKGRLELVSKTEENTEIFAACIGEDVIGTCNVEYTRSHAVIYEFQIYEEYRGNGYGSEMLLLILRELLNEEVSKILLHVSGANTVAHTMYSHHGFISEEQIDYWSEL